MTAAPLPSCAQRKSAPPGTNAQARVSSQGHCPQITGHFPGIPLGHTWTFPKRRCALRGSAPCPCVLGNAGFSLILPNSALGDSVLEGWGRGTGPSWTGSGAGCRGQSLSCLVTCERTVRSTREGATCGLFWAPSPVPHTVTAFSSIQKWGVNCSKWASSPKGARGMAGSAMP